MNRFKRNEDGAFAVEAVFGLTLFMLAVLSIMFISLFIRVQANMQYALGQTAKEISGYYYLLDKVGLASLTTGTSTEDVSKLDDTIGRILDFSDSASTTVEGINLENGVSFDTLQQLSQSGADVKELYAEAQNICSQAKELITDENGKINPVGQIKAVLSVFGKSMLCGGISYYIAPFVCQVIMPKYLSGDAERSDAYLASVGIEGGVDSLDFTQSQLLMDGRSVKLAVTYTLNTRALTFGLVDVDLNFKQTATTAAWIKPEGSKKQLSKLPLPEGEESESEPPAGEAPTEESEGAS